MGKPLFTQRFESVASLDWTIFEISNIGLWNLNPFILENLGFAGDFLFYKSQELLPMIVGKPPISRK